MRDREANFFHCMKDLHIYLERIVLGIMLPKAPAEMIEEQIQVILELQNDVSPVNQQSQQNNQSASSQRKMKRDTKSSNDGTT